MNDNSRAGETPGPDGTPGSDATPRSGEESLLDVAEVYALDAVDAVERLEIEARLAAAPAGERSEFLRRVAVARATMADFSSSRLADPPPALKGRILAGLPQQPRVAGVGRPGTAGAASSATVASGAAPSDTARTETAPSNTAPSDAAPSETASVADNPPDEIAARRAGREAAESPRRTRRSRYWLAAAAAVILIGAGFGAGYATRPAPGAGDLQAQVLAAGDAVVHTAEIGEGATTTLVVSKSADASVVTLSGLSAPEAGKAYQMWLISDGEARSVSVMGPDDVHPVVAVLIKGTDEAQRFALSVEPAGGSPRPTTTPFSVIDL